MIRNIYQQEITWNRFGLSGSTVSSDKKQNTLNNLYIQSSGNTWHLEIKSFLQIIQHVSSIFDSNP